ncbi:MAG: acyl-CoA dehydrogenase, partial [Nitrospinota bacterium]
TEESARFDPAGIQMRAESTPDGAFLLNGLKLFVPYAHVADLLICPVRTAGGTGEEGITLLLVERETAGVEWEKLETIADDHQCAVHFREVRVPPDRVLGEVGQDGLF